MYVIYGKGNGMKRYAPLAGTGFVVNLLHAETWPTRGAAMRALATIQPANPEYTWEIRKVGE